MRNRETGRDYTPMGRSLLGVGKRLSEYQRSVVVGSFPSFLLSSPPFAFHFVSFHFVSFHCISLPFPPSFPLLYPPFSLPFFLGQGKFSEEVGKVGMAGRRLVVDKRTSI